MSTMDGAQRVLEKMLANLGLEATVEQGDYHGAPLLDIRSEDSRHIIGRGGDRLDDFQYLVNRIVQKHVPDAPRVRVDCNGYRAEREERLISEVRALAEEVVADGQPRETKAMNAYHRRIIHNALGDLAVATESLEGNGRTKRVRISAKVG